MGTLCHLARPERFELPTAWFVARYSIQLSYGRFVCGARSLKIYIEFVNTGTGASRFCRHLPPNVNIRFYFKGINFLNIYSCL